jgi:hypothetical protein
MEVQGSYLPKVWLIHVDIKALALIDIATTINGHVNNSFLLDLPNSPVPVINKHLEQT